MGFLDSLFKKNGNGGVLSDCEHLLHAIVDEKLDAVLAKEFPQYTAEKEVSATVNKKLDAVLAREFPQYTVEKEVSATVFGGKDTYMPYSYIIYDEMHVPRLIIMVVYNNTCASAAYKRSRELAEAGGHTLINFVYAFENRMDYIVNRLHQYL